MTMKDLSPRDLATALGVSQSSVKRWVDDGALAGKRTAGGHRRIPVAEAVRFVRSTGSPLVRPDVIVGLGADAPVEPFDAAASLAMGERLFGLLEGDDVPAARALLAALYASGWPVAAIGDGPIRLAMERIGALWRHGPEGIVVEHRATDTCLRALAEMRALFTPPAPDAPAAVGAGPSDDPYTLPSMMAAAVLADLGYRDRNLGPETPLAVLEQAADRYGARVVWLAMSVPPADEGVARETVELARRLARRGATLVVGGRGAPALPPADGLLQVHSMAELAAFARGAGTVVPRTPGRRP
jgi:excisionase family DNA binding protein